MLFKGLNKKTGSYTVLLAAAAAAIATWASVQWPAEWDSGTGATFGVLLGLAVLTAAFPLKVAPQAWAVVVGAPLMAAIIVLGPAQAVIVAAAAMLATPLRMKRPMGEAWFNVGMGVLSVALGCAVFQSADVPAGGLALISGKGIGYAVAAGAAFQAANIALMLPLMLFIKGPAFFGQWRKTLVLDLASETGVLGIGIAGAVLVAEEWWAALFLAVPVALAYLALASSVREAAENIKLARQVQRQMDELKATQEQLVQQEKMASIGTLAAGVAHEINNPLFAINAAAQVLLRQKGRHLASDRAAKYVESILNMADSASKITTDLLRFSRSKATPEPLSLPEVMDAALVLVSADLTFRGVTVKREYGPVPPVLAHRSQLQQVFVNLLMNARDAAPQNGTVTLRCHGENGHVVASVSDTGPGIPPDALPHIFEPFYTTKAVGKGTGLGLYICHKIVTEHNGQIRASSKAGEGTEMTVVLPSMAAEPARPAPVSSGERQNGAAAGVQSEPAPAETGPSGGRSYR